MPLFCESLEGRRLLSAGGQAPVAGVGGKFDPFAFGAATVVQNGTTLTISNAHDLQAIEQGPGEVRVFDFGGRTDITYYDVTTLVINGTRAGDQIGVGNDTLAATINAGGGNDSITVADKASGSTIVHAGAGKDLITLSRTYFNSGTRVFGDAGMDVYDGPDGPFVQ